MTGISHQGLKKWLIPSLIHPYDEYDIITNGTQEIDIDDPYIAIKNTLDAAKSKLDKLNTETYLKTMNIVDPFNKSFKRMVKYEYNLTITTNASLKMLELLYQFPLIDCNNPIRVFCDAELPGAFIVAINHYIRSEFPDCNFEWVASSFLPTDNTKKNNTILEDVYNIYSKNRTRWLMGPKPNAILSDKYTNGDLTSSENLRILSDAVKEKFGGVNLYTSDAGIDVSDDYNNQEELTMLLNFGQCLCGLLSIANGGSFVTKQYTFFHPFNRSLILLLSSLFDELYIVKPETSRPANSEIYIIGISFRGMSVELSELLLEKLDNCSKLSPHDWSPIIDIYNYPEIDDILLRISNSLFIDTQTKHLNNLASFDMSEDNVRHTSYINMKILEQWFINNPIKKLLKGLEINA